MAKKVKNDKKYNFFLKIVQKCSKMVAFGYEMCYDIIIKSRGDVFSWHFWVNLTIK